jgi:hypothetical protein
MVSMSETRRMRTGRYVKVRRCLVLDVSGWDERDSSEESVRRHSLGKCEDRSQILVALVTIVQVVSPILCTPMLLITVQSAIEMRIKPTPCADIHNNNHRLKLPTTKIQSLQS